MPADLPSTPQSAPPNFYDQVGKMASGPGQTPAAGGKAPPAQPMDADHEFLDTVNKLLNVLAKIGQMNPRGQDVSKFTQAAADAMKDCVAQVFNGEQDVPGADGSAPAGGAQTGADMGAGSGGAGGMSGGGAAA